MKKLRRHGYDWEIEHINGEYYATNYKLGGKSLVSKSLAKIEELMEMWAKENY